MPPQRSVGRVYSYRVSLAVAIPLIVGATGALIIALTSTASRHSIRQLSDRLFQEISRRTVEQTTEQLGEAIPAVETARALLAEMAHRDDPGLPDALFAFARAHPRFTWVSYSDASGAFTGVFHGTDGSWRLNVSRIHDGKTELHEYDLSETGQRTLRRHLDDSGYDPRHRPFYELAAKERRRVWTPPYVFYEAGVPGVSCASPQLDAQGNVQGVFTIDIDLNRLSVLAASLKPSEHGRVFLYAPDGTLLAHPTVRVVEKTGQRGEGKLLTTREVDDPALQSYVAAAASPKLMEQAAGEGVAHFTFFHRGEPYVGVFDTVEVDQGMSWIVGGFAPESDFTGDVEHNLTLMYLLSGLAVMIALGLSVYLANRMSQPLAEVTEEMEKVGEFRLETRALPRTPFREIAVLNRTLETMKGSLRSFSSYVPKDLVRAVVASGQEAKLEGKVKELTIFFSDIANFTSFAETMKPDALVQRLGVYLEEMTRLIGARGGTVDKFIGDGIMAFWGAPGEMADHAAQACRAALECKRRLEELRKDPSRPWMQQLGTRIGLCTGEALVGNIGTPERMNYTVMGDTVNLASRLEGLNKAYGTVLLAAETTVKAAPEIVARPLDVVAVKGKAQGVRVYELLALAQDQDQAALELVRLSTDALDAYLRRDFARAAETWRRILKLRPSDRAAEVMASRAEELLRSPPPADWSGVHHAHEK